jgi:hypothetical protein
MAPARIAYSLDGSRGRAALSIRLEADVGAPPAEVLKWFHVAAEAWEKQHRGILLRADLDGGASPGAAHVTASDYLYGDGTFNPSRFHRHLSMLADHGSVHRSIPQPGAPVEGRDLWGREEERGQLRCLIESGSCHLQGPRRYGKTSLLKSLDQALAAEGCPAVMLDVSACATAAEFLATLVSAAMERPPVRAALTPHLRELRGWPEAGAATDVDARSTARTRLLEAIQPAAFRFGQRLFAALAGVSTVLLVDEFSLFLRGILQRSQEETKALLELLRQARQGTPPVRQAVAGSAGLSSFVKFHGLGAYLGDLSPVPVKPLDEGTAKGLAEELVYGSGLRPSPGMAGAVLEDIGLPVPYFIQALADAGRAEAADRSVVDEATVHTSYRERLLGPVGNQLFRVYRLDYQPYPDDMRRAAARILAVLARSPRGESRAGLAGVYRKAVGVGTGLESLLACLSEDYDLGERAGRWQFRSKVLRERWLLFGQTAQ